MAKDADALNYPFIRVRNVEWLKRTLLIFPHVARIRPRFGAPPDEEDIDAFRRVNGRRGALLRDVSLEDSGLWEDHLEVQRRIREALRRDRHRILARFGKEGTQKEAASMPGADLWEDRLSRESFQLHSDKIVSQLLRFLLGYGLAWEPHHPEGPEYIEMHPQVGEAILCTLAFACADHEGLELVTEFPRVFGRSIHQSKEDLLDSFLDLREDGWRSRFRKKTSDRKLPEFVVYQRCDTTKLTPERLAALSQEWEAIAEFRDALEKMAESLPDRIGDPKVLTQRLHDQASDMFRQWERDKANLSSFARELFGDGALEQPQKLMEKVAEKALGPEAVGAIAGGLTGQSLIAAGGGFAVGVIFRAGRSAVKVRRAARESPLRYLTMMEKEGVSFSVSS
jgi:hypothetical protein